MVNRDVKPTAGLTFPCKREIGGEASLHTPFVPAKAGSQSSTDTFSNVALGPRFRGDERDLFGVRSAS